MSNWVLIKYADNWADEFDVQGFWVMSSLKWKHQQELIKYGIYPVKLDLGNECIYYDTPGQLEETLQVVSLDSDSANAIQNALIVDGHYGLVPELPQAPRPGERSPIRKNAYCHYCQSMTPVSRKTEDYWDDDMSEMVPSYMYMGHYINPDQADDTDKPIFCIGSNEDVDKGELVDA